MKPTRSKVLITVCLLGVICGLSRAWADDLGLVGWWPMDETDGTVLADASGYGHDGSLEVFGGGTGNNTRWLLGPRGGGCLYIGGDAFVILPIGDVIASLQDCTIAGWLYFVPREGMDWERMFDFGKGTSNYIFFTPNTDTGTMRLALRTSVIGEEDQVDGGIYPTGWHHVTATVDSAAKTMALYLDAAEVGRNTDLRNRLSDLGKTGSNWLGRSQFSDSAFSGYLDDLMIFNRALTPEEITRLYDGSLLRQAARNPVPADGQTDVPRDTLLTWQPGESARQHYLFLGDSFEDVNQAGPAVPTVGPGLVPTASYDPGRLDFGQQLFWRVDEVEGPPAQTVHRGRVWSFTVENEFMPIAAEDIVATASSETPGQGPDKTLDGSGLDAGGGHSSDIEDMWATAADAALPAWIEYTFDKPYRLQSCSVWNYNGLSFLAILGAQTVTVETSLDGVDWTVVQQDMAWPMATGADGYASDIEIDFGGQVARAVRFTITANHSGGFYDQCGLSEVRFWTVPLSARDPVPADGAQNVDPRSLASWRAGRQAASHRVSLSTDAAAVENGTAPSVTVSEAQVDLSQFTLPLGQTVTWRVDEVNEAADPAAWSSSLWSFTVAEAIAVDDFEAYHNVSPQRPFETWIDGLGFTTPAPGNPGNGTGSIVGHDIWSGPHLDAFLMENSIVHGGKQSLPVYYVNSPATTARIDRRFSPAQNWSQWGVSTLRITLYGQPDNTGQLYVEINGNRILYDGPSDRLATEDWTAWDIDLSTVGNLTQVSTLSIGIDGSGASGLIYLDDIELR